MQDTYHTEQPCHRNSITDGWDIICTQDDYGDCIKNDWDARAPDGSLHEIYWSSYQPGPDYDDLTMLIAIGFDVNPPTGHWNKQRLVDYLAQANQQVAA